MIDWARVIELRDEIGHEDFADVTEIFLEEMEEGIVALQTGLVGSTVEEQLHFLKGSALNIGFSEFAEKCAAGEDRAARGVHDQVDLEGIIHAYQSSRTEFLENMQSRFAA